MHLVFSSCDSTALLIKAEGRVFTALCEDFFKEKYPKI